MGRLVDYIKKHLIRLSIYLVGKCWSILAILPEKDQDEIVAFAGELLEEVGADIRFSTEFSCMKCGENYAIDAPLMAVIGDGEALFIHLPKGTLEPSKLN